VEYLLGLPTTCSKAEIYDLQATFEEKKKGSHPAFTGLDQAHVRVTDRFFAVPRPPVTSNSSLWPHPEKRAQLKAIVGIMLVGETEAKDRMVS